MRKKPSFNFRTLSSMVPASIKQKRSLSDYVIYASLFLLYAMCMVHLGSWAAHIHDGFINHTGDTSTVFAFFSLASHQAIVRDVMAVAMTLVADLILVRIQYRSNR